VSDVISEVGFWPSSEELCRCLDTWLMLDLCLISAEIVRKLKC